MEEKKKTVLKLNTCISIQRWILNSTYQTWLGTSKNEFQMYFVVLIYILGKQGWPL